MIDEEFHGHNRFDLPDRRQIEIWKKMSFQQKYEVWQGIQKEARALKRAGLRQQFPNDTAEEINRKLAKAFVRART